MEREATSGYRRLNRLPVPSDQILSGKCRLNQHAGQTIRHDPAVRTYMGTSRCSPEARDGSSWSPSIAKSDSL